MQVCQTVVEFMVSQIADGVIQGVHRLINRMHSPLFKSFCRHIVAQWATLNNIAVIHQHAVFRFRAGFFNQAGGSDQAEFFRRGIFVVIEIHHIAVQIGGFHDPEVDRRRVDAGRHQRGQQRCAKLNHQRRPFLWAMAQKKMYLHSVAYRIVNSARKAWMETASVITDSGTGDDAI